MKLIINNGVKSFRSEDYNWDFDMSNGLFKRWGRTLKDDPSWSPYGPEISDMEISYGSGCSIKCPWCSPAGTMVNTPFGKSCIETLKSGDMVIGYNVTNKTIKLQKIEETYTHQFRGNLICMELSNGEILKLTPDHEVYTELRGWIPAKNIAEDDNILEF